MLRTATGNFPIGFRYGRSEWQEAQALIAFAKARQFEFIDLPALPTAELQMFLNAGLKIGSVALVQPWDGLASDDAARQAETIEIMSQQIYTASALGVTRFFMVAFQEDLATTRRLAFGYLAIGLTLLAKKIEGTSATIAIEGYPGAAPHYNALVCTPEACRSLFKVVSDRVGINYDPSHLIRMGIDPVRFLNEFADRVYHVHAKDTALLDDRLYELGNLQRPIRAASIPYGGNHWRYTIPGHGVAPWQSIFAILRDRGYTGGISIELEDADYLGTEAMEQEGFIAARNLLTTT